MAQTITTEEYMERLRLYVGEQFQLLPEAEKPKGLRANVEFNKEKAREFAQLLAEQGITIE